MNAHQSPKGEYVSSLMGVAKRIALLRVLALPVSLALGAFPLASAAAAFPDRPIQMVVPFAAGGGLDSNARAFGQALAKIVKVPVVVVNTAGAAGSIGLSQVARAPADGYTLAFTPAVSLTSEPHRVKTIKYNLDSFTPVCQVFDNIFAVVVAGDSPYRTIGDLIEKARSKPNAVSYGTSGMGSIPHLGMSDIEAATKVQLTHIPYKGDGPMLQDLLGGQIEVGAMLASSISGQIESGKLRLLAVFSDQRHPGFPNVPTVKEAGVPVVQLSFGGILLPANAPPAVLKVLQEACAQAMKSPNYLEWASRAGQVLEYQPSTAFAKKIREDSTAKETTIKRLDLRD